MFRRFRVAFILFPFLLFPAAPCFSGDNSAIRNAAGTVLSDFETFYLGKDNLLRLGIGLGVAGLFANTKLDREIQNWYQDDVRCKWTDDVSQAVRPIGTIYVVAPVYLGGYGAGYLFRSPTLGEWSERAARATLVGAPAVMVLQPLLGGARPSDGSSRWNPFHDDHGVSGHAFFGAVPFITAAMMSENIFWKATYYGLSTLTGISRINDDAHYFSQAALGWFLGYLSCDVVGKVGSQRAGQVPIGLTIHPKGMAVTWHF